MVVYEVTVLAVPPTIFHPLHYIRGVIVIEAGAAHPLSWNVLVMTILSHVNEEKKKKPFVCVRVMNVFDPFSKLKVELSKDDNST